VPDPWDEGTDKMKTVKTEDFIVKYKDDDKTQKAVFKMVVGFFLKHEVFTGESIMQCDVPQIDAPEFLCDLAERIGFQTKIKENMNDSDEEE